MPIDEPQHMPAFEDPGDWQRAELRELNQSPASYLAAVGTRHGAVWHTAFDHALDLIERFGTSRTIRAADASALCHQMRIWATGNDPPPLQRSRSNGIG